MTIEMLREQPIGVLETRKLTIKSEDMRDETDYYLVKSGNDKYYVGFSDDSRTNSQTVSESHMVMLIEDKGASDNMALELYAQSPQLSCWLE